MIMFISVNGLFTFHYKIILVNWNMKRPPEKTEGGTGRPWLTN
jgi:hypothetical protein